MSSNNIKIKQKKLATKLSFYILLGVFLIFLILIIVISNSIMNDLIVRESEKLTLLAEENSKVARDFMQTMVNKQDVLISVIKNIEKIKDEERVEFIKSLVSGIKENESNVLGVFFVAEPNKFVSNTTNGFSIFSTAINTHVEGIDLLL